MTVNKTSTSLDKWFLCMWVIKRDIANKLGIWVCSRKYSLNSSTTVSIADGVCIKSLGMSCVCNWNQSSGANFFKARTPHASFILFLHQEIIHLTTRIHDLSSIYSFSRMNSNRFWPFTITFMRSPQDKPYMTICFILCPATSITWGMHHFPISTNRSLSTNSFRFQ